MGQELLFPVPLLCSTSEKEKKKKKSISSKAFGLLKQVQMLHERQCLVAESVTTSDGSVWPPEN